MSRNTILVVVGHYLPGFKAGGPIRTLANLVAWLGDEFDFRILTRDRDLGDTTAFHDVTLGAWQTQGQAQVMYLPRQQRAPLAWARLLSTLDYDTLYLNSFFDTLSVQSVVLRCLGLVPRRPLVIAPRGEFSAGALGLKALKKRVYITLVKRVGLYRDVTWQASSEHERRDIAAIFAPHSPVITSVHVAPNLPPRLFPVAKTALPCSKVSGHARVVFVGRIARMKNLSFALGVLADAQGEIELNICGPAEDTIYWEECQALIRRLPANVRARYLGAIPNARVFEVLSEAHLFFLPTLGENFGHGIFEAFSAGCPVLISDRTPWRDLTLHSAGWDLPLEQPDMFVSALNTLVAMSESEWAGWSAGARKLAIEYSAGPDTLEANRRLFLKAGY